MNDKYIIPMLETAFEILEYMSRNKDEYSLSTIAQNLGIPKTTVFRIITTMQKWGYIEKTADQEKYKLGKSLIKIGQHAASGIDITDIAMPYITDLSRLMGEGSNLGILHENEILTIANAKGEDFYLISRLIPMSPLNCSAMGKQYMARFSDDELKNYFKSSKPQKRTVNSIMSYEEFLLERDIIINEGISYDREEYEYGLSCIAAPIFDSKGSMIAAISVSGPTTRLQHKGEEMLKNELIKSSRAITKAFADIFQDLA